MGTQRFTRFAYLCVPITKWRIAESPPTFRYCCILHFLTHFLFFKPAVPSVFCILWCHLYMYVNFSCVPQFSRVMYGNYSCYYSLYGFVVETRIITTEPMVVSKPVSVGYTIYSFTINILTNCNTHTSLIQCWYTIHAITATGYWF